MTVDAPGTPPAEVDISQDLISRLVALQFPDLARLPVEIVGEGWDNVMARIGDELAARVPRHAVGAKLLAREQRWLPELAPRLPLPIPAPIHIGKSSEDYPFTWSIVQWFEGECADLSPPDGSEAGACADLLCAVHKPAPMKVPKNTVRDRRLDDNKQDT